MFDRTAAIHEDSAVEAFTLNDTIIGTRHAGLADRRVRVD
jgi:hypothetical protein